MQLALGTAQFGLTYGIAGRGAPVPDDEARAILEDAAERGIRWLDTATDYGDIESRLATLTQGLHFDIISKIPPIPDALEPDAAALFALKSARASSQRLGRSLRGLMLHRAMDLSGARGDAVWGALSGWAQSEGIRLGASCYAPEECLALVRERGIALAQLPGSALDQRIVGACECPEMNHVEIHLRSVFLQGLLLMEPGSAIARLPAAEKALARWHRYCEQQDVPAVEAALSIVKSFKKVSAVVVGVDRLSQWTEITRAWDRAEAEVASYLASDVLEIVDPRRWSFAL